MTPDKSRESAEEVYIAVYGVMSENADYVQPEHGPDLLLPLEIVELLTSTAIVSVLGGALTEVGKKLGKKVPFRKGNLTRVEREELIGQLAENLSGEELRLEDMPEARGRVRSALLEAGLSPPVADKISEQVIAKFLRNLSNEDE